MRLLKSSTLYWVIFFMVLHSSLSAAFHTGFEYWNGQLGLNGIGLQQAFIPQSEFPMWGVFLSVQTGRWTLSASGRYGKTSFNFQEYQANYTETMGEALVDAWGDPYVLRYEDLNAELFYLNAEASLALKVFPFLSIKGSYLYRKIERAAQEIEADLYTVDWLNHAWYGEGTVHTELPVFTNEGGFIGGGLDCHIPLWASPIHILGSAIVLAPIDADQDLRLRWSAGVTWQNLFGFDITAGYRDEINAKDSERERMYGFTMGILYRIF